MKTVFAVIAAAILLASGGAGAHTKAIGYHNAGAGSVTFWFQSWHGFSAPFFEGSFNLVGINGNPFPSTTVPFNLSVGVKPALLVDGVNNFFACNRIPNGLCPTDEDAQGGTKWQGVTFSGLQAGDYRFTYIPIVNPSADWAPATQGVQTNTLSLSGVIVGGPPTASDIPTLSEWSLIILALLLGTVTLYMRRRR